MVDPKQVIRAPSDPEGAEVETDDDWLGRWGLRFASLMDDQFRIPFTNIRFGFDSILGLLAPGVGDVTTGAGSVGLLTLALRRRVPSVVIGRMVLNIAVDVVMGAVPLVGDAFDVAWRSNRRNLDLIEQYTEASAKPGWVDYLLVGFGIVLAILSIVLPFVVVAYLGTRFGPELWADWFG